jgi:hypothetical protein
MSGTATPRRVGVVVSALRAVLLRELAAVRRTVEAYPDDASLWVVRPGLPNVGGTLVLHLGGNLQHYLGAVLGRSGYQRDRDAEFSRRDVPRALLLGEIDAARQAIDLGMPVVSDEMLAAPYPEQIAGRTVTTGDFLVHLATHLAFHLGQLDYHRRVVTGDTRSIGAIAVSELPVRDHGSAFDRR